LDNKVFENIVLIKREWK